LTEKNPQLDQTHSSPNRRVFDWRSQTEWIQRVYETDLQIISAQQQHIINQEGNDRSLAGGHGW